MANRDHNAIHPPADFEPISDPMSSHSKLLQSMSKGSKGLSGEQTSGHEMANSIMKENKNSKAGGISTSEYLANSLMRGIQIKNIEEKLGHLIDPKSI